jgi:hypothetical protein
MNVFQRHAEAGGSFEVLKYERDIIYLAVTNTYLLTFQGIWFIHNGDDIHQYFRSSG